MHEWQGREGAEVVRFVNHGCGLDRGREEVPFAVFGGWGTLLHGGLREELDMSVRLGRA